MRNCYLSHAWRPDTKVKYMGEDVAAPGYAIVCHPDYGAITVPVDQIVFKDEEDYDDLL